MNPNDPDNRCTTCGQHGHRASHCPQEPWKQTEFVLTPALYDAGVAEGLVSADDKNILPMARVRSFLISNPSTGGKSWVQRMFEHTPAAKAPRHDDLCWFDECTDFSVQKWLDFCARRKTKVASAVDVLLSGPAVPVPWGVHART